VVYQRAKLIGPNLNFLYTISIFFFGLSHTKILLNGPSLIAIDREAERIRIHKFFREILEVNIFSTSHLTNQPLNL
jgi:hypothetical protein